MALRNTMLSLIETLRGFTQAGTADFTLAGNTYWTDEQLQDVLDRYSVELLEAPLVSHSTMNTDNETEWKKYAAYVGWFEETSGGSARFVVTDGLGNISASSGYSVDYVKGLVTFDADQGGSARYVTGYSYDIYGAAADIWDQKAAYYATMINFSTDGHSVKRDHIVAQCEKMAKRYASLSFSSGSSSVEIVRGDSTWA